MFEYSSAAAQLLQEPKFYKFQLYTAHKNFPLPQIAGPPKLRARVLQHPCTSLNAALVVSVLRVFLCSDELVPGLC